MESEDFNKPLTANDESNNNIKLFSCSSCAKKFKEINSLKRHFKTHKGEKPFSCNICSKKFSEKFNLRTHERKYHEKHSSETSALEEKKDVAADKHLKKLHDFIENNGLRGLSVSKC